MVELRKHQLDAVNNLRNGNILWGNVGSGKTLTALAYYTNHESPRDIYVITTAKKRDSLDWNREAAKFGIGTEDGATLAGILTVDSWNSIGRYSEVKDAFFIFDEQRLVGYGAWVKAFFKIAKNNHWIMLSGTPGDVWLDYAPVFIANGFYKNLTEFKREHVVYEPFKKYPKVRGYLDKIRLEKQRNSILVEMPYESHTERYLNYLGVGHDEEALIRLRKNRWHLFEDRPIKDISELFRMMRKVVNTDPSRLDTVRELMKIHPRLIIFYNFNYELNILRELYGEIEVGEWNGHRKDPVPNNASWVYLVQYVSGCEGWNCIETDAMILYSMTPSYKNFIQSLGRIDRLNTPFSKLYYYIFVSNSKIDLALRKALGEKRNFNERKFVNDLIDGRDVDEEKFEVCQI